jgi:hypothetical protein
VVRLDAILITSWSIWLGVQKCRNYGLVNGVPVQGGFAAARFGHAQGDFSKDFSRDCAKDFTRDFTKESLETGSRKKLIPRKS